MREGDWPNEERALLQTLAAIGPEFPHSLIRQVVGVAEDELLRMLSAPQLAEFISDQPTDLKDANTLLDELSG